MKKLKKEKKINITIIKIVAFLVVMVFLMAMFFLKVHAVFVVVSVLLVICAIIFFGGMVAIYAIAIEMISY